MEDLKKQLTTLAVQVGKELVKATTEVVPPPLYPTDGRNIGPGSEFDKANKASIESTNHKNRLNQLFGTLLSAIQQVP